MRSFVHALVFGAWAKEATHFFVRKTGHVDATSVVGAVLTERLSERSQSRTSRPQAIHLAEGPVADLRDPRHAVWALRERWRRPAEPAM